MSRPQIIAHRGASHDQHENTTAAFRLAAEMGADAVELDVRLSAGGVLVVHHDPIQGDLPPHVPTLEEALAACEGMWVNVEIKNDGDLAVADRTMELLISLISVGEPDRWLVSSFDRATIDRCQQLAPSIRTALISLDVEPALAAGHAAFHPFAPLVTPELVTACHEAGLAINVWTVDDPGQIAQFAAWGVDGIITNRPDLALQITTAFPHRQGA